MLIDLVVRLDEITDNKILKFNQNEEAYNKLKKIIRTNLQVPFDKDFIYVHKNKKIEVLPFEFITKYCNVKITTKKIIDRYVFTLKHISPLT
jgi:hypothetical protein